MYHQFKHEKQSMEQYFEVMPFDFNALFETNLKTDIDCLCTQLKNNASKSLVD